MAKRKLPPVSKKKKKAKPKKLQLTREGLSAGVSSPPGL